MLSSAMLFICLQASIYQVLIAADVVNMFKSALLHDSGCLTAAVPRTAVKVVGLIFVEAIQLLLKLSGHQIIVMIGTL